MIPVGGPNQQQLIPYAENQRRLDKIPEAPKLEFLKGDVLEVYSKAIEKAQVAKGKDIVAFVGVTGTGKSTCVNSLLGHDLELVDDEIHVTGDCKGPKIGHGLRSESTFAETFDVEGQKFSATDTGGFCDTFGTEKDYTNAVSMYLTLQAASSVRFVVCSPVDQIAASRVGQFEKTVRLLNDEILRGRPELIDSIVLLATREDDIAKAKRLIDKGFKKLCEYDKNLQPFFERIKRDNGKFIKIFDPTNRSDRLELIQLIKELPIITDKKAIRAGYPDTKSILSDFLLIARYETNLILEFLANKTEVGRVSLKINELAKRILKLEQDRTQIKTTGNVEPDEHNAGLKARLAKIPQEIAELDQALKKTLEKHQTSQANLQELLRVDGERRELGTLTFDFTGKSRTREVPNRNQECQFDEEIGQIVKSISAPDNALWNEIKGGIGRKYYAVRFIKGAVTAIHRVNPNINKATIKLYGKQNFQKEAHNQAKNNHIAKNAECESRKEALLREKAELEKEKWKVQLFIEQAKDIAVCIDLSQKILGHIEEEIKMAKESKKALNVYREEIFKRNKKLNDAVDENAKNYRFISQHIELCNDVVSENSEIQQFKVLKEAFNQQKDN